MEEIFTCLNVLWMWFLKKNNEGIMVMLRKEESGIKDKNRKIM